MSTFRVNLTTIEGIIPHPSAERLEIAVVYGYYVIVGKDQYKAGDKILYVPVGAILSEQLDTLLFPPDSKVKLHNRRIRAIKLRGVVSQGFIIDPKHLGVSDDLDNMLEQDFAEDLGITKYTEPVKSLPGMMNPHQIRNILKNPDFKEYTDVEHGKYYDRQVMVTGEEVIVTQKLHGTSARYGWFKRPVRNLWDKALTYFNIMPEYEFCWGSRRAQINSKPEKSHPGFKSEKQGCDFGDVYTKIKHQENLMKKLPKGYAVYGEIVGWGIQKGYLYHAGLNQHKFYVYDVQKDGKYLNYDDAIKLCNEWGLTHVPLVYRGPYIMDEINKQLTNNTISLEPNEGICVKPVQDRHSPVMGRVVLKYINPEYLLLKDGTEFQ